MSILGQSVGGGHVLLKRKYFYLPSHPQEKLIRFVFHISSFGINFRVACCEDPEASVDPKYSGYSHCNKSLKRKDFTESQVFDLSLPEKEEAPELAWRERPCQLP